MKKLWTLEEDNILIEFAKKGVKLSKIADKLDRTENAVRLRCKRLGIQIMAKGRHWTKEEEEQFKEEWCSEDVSHDTLVRRHNRTWHALQEKAFSMGLGSRPQNTSYVTVMDICQEMNVSSDRVYAWIKLGLNVHKSNDKRTKYLIDTDELLVFLEHNQHLFDASEVSQFLFIQEPEWLKNKRRKDGSIDISNKGTEWSFQDDKILVSLYEKGYSVEKLAQIFKRSEIAIITHLNILGVKRKRANEYSEEELKVLYEYSNEKTLKELATMLPGRTVKGLEYKCKSLGIPYHLSSRRCDIN